MLEVEIEKAGIQGLSAYEVAVQNGYEGTEEEWLAQLRYDHSDEFAEFVEDIHTTVENFDTNAETKLNSFNDNATSKTTEYNTNHTTKLKAYNDNTTSKTNTFNSNATSKTNTFNSNVTAKTNEFDAHTTEKLQEYDTNAAEKLQEFNTNAESYDKRISDNTSRIKRLETDIFDSGEASGSTINIQDSTLAEFQEVAIDGVCEQVVTTGKNLWGGFEEYTQTSGGVTFTTSNGKITAKGTSSGSATSISIATALSKGVYVTLPAGTYTLSCSPNHKTQIQIYDTDSVGYGAISPGISSKTFTLNEEKNIVIRSQIGIDENLTIDETIEIQLENGDTATDIEPYTGGEASPNSNWQQPISVIDKDFNVKSITKNLFDYINNTTGTTDFTQTINKDGSITVVGIPSSNYRTLISEDITDKLENGKTYTFGSGTSNTKLHLQLQYTDTNTGKNTYLSATSKPITFTADTSKNIYRLKLITSSVDAWGAESLTITNTYQLEPGDELTEFEPYQENKIEIPIPEGEFAGKINETYKDQFQIKWNDEEKEYWLYLSKKLGRVVLDGTETWQMTSSQALTNTSYFGTSVIDNMFENKNYFMCDYFQRKILWANDVEGMELSSNERNLRLRINKSKASTPQEFQTWLANNPVTVYYNLAKQYQKEIPIMPVDMLLTYLGQTNVFTDSELNPNMSVKYYREFLATIRNLQVNNGTLQSELVDVQSRLSALETSLNNLLVSQVSGQVESEVTE